MMMNQRTRNPILWICCHPANSIWKNGREYTPTNPLVPMLWLGGGTTTIPKDIPSGSENTNITKNARSYS